MPRVLPLFRGAGVDDDALWWEALSMTRAAKTVIEAFDELGPQERKEVVLELLRRSALDPHEAPSDDDLVHAADQVFLELERHEAG